MPITPEMIHDYQRDGFVIAKDLFSRLEVDALLRDLDSEFIANLTHDTRNGQGQSSRFAIWHELKQDVWGAASSCPRIVEGLRQLMGEEISFYHGKVIFKEPGSSASWEWHQDYGYWYHSFLHPRMASAWVALDPSTIDNGCLQVLRGSHRLGRLEHGTMGDQLGVDRNRLEQIRPLFEEVDCEVEPGSVIFFDSHLLHASRPNTSARFRRSFIMCYAAHLNLEIVPGGKPLQRPPCPVSSDQAILHAATAMPRG